MKYSLATFALMSIAAGAVVPGRAMAQTNALAGNAADSATMARTQFRSAREMLSKGDTAGALEKLVAAAKAWPYQPAYSNALLDLAMKAGDAKRITLAIETGNQIGVALAATETLTTASEAQNALMAVQKQLRSPIANGTQFRTLTDSTLFPEAIAIDPRNGTLYVSSVHHRNVVAVAPDGRQSSLLQNNPAGVGSIFGIALDTTRGLLWAASAPNDAMKGVGDTGKAVAALLAIRLRDGQLVRRVAIPAAIENSSPGDLALSPNGDVLLSDSQAGILWLLRNSADTLIALRHELFRSLQGVVPSPDGKTAWVADYSHGLLKVDLNSASVERVADRLGHTTVGLDGLVRYGNSFVAVQNGFNPMQVVQIKLNQNGTKVVEQRVIDRHPLAISPTGGVIVGDSFVYVANSLWELLDANGKLPSNAALPRPLLLQIKLAR